jgi:hypothetical protein
MLLFDTIQMRTNNDDIGTVQRLTCNIVQPSLQFLWDIY